MTPSADRPSGGHLYNARIVRALRAQGVQTRLLEAPGTWPTPSASEREALRSRLASPDVVPAGARVVVDGLIAAGAPEILADDRPRGCLLLVHLPVAFDGADEATIRAEARAVAAAGTVVVTSRWAAEEVRRRYGRHDAVVIVPGTAPIPAPTVEATGGRSVDVTASSDREPHLAVVASLTPRKNHRLVGAALAGLTGHRWRLHLAGPGADTPFGRCLLSELRGTLSDRLTHHGAVPAEDMGRFWAETDLLLLPSTAETYGMVITEAAAHGVPAFVSQGTGAVEAMDGAGRALPPEAPDAWRSALRRWLTDSQERDDLRTAVARRRDRLPTWPQSAHRWTNLVRSPPTG